MGRISLKPRTAWLSAAALILVASGTAEACSWNGLRSKASAVPTPITFINQSGAYRALNWMDFQGLPQNYGGLNSGERKTLNTFVTHPWVITDGPGNCIQVVMPRPGGSTIRLAGAKKPTRGEEGAELRGCPPGTVPIPETDNCRPVRRGR